ncbi:hypothetical protein Dda_7687 [Drechslerella dactyloides]|uniref:Uncharacterized protein n=1 Tax=Drechslerella dactyloides TaxID=74499 RepID=A0AAD6IT34_DREDA|nr:hypothetical protein Dda_7687 [Drechslerella dactyloides]
MAGAVNPAILDIYQEEEDASLNYVPTALELDDLSTTAKVESIRWFSTQNPDPKVDRSRSVTKRAENFTVKAGCGLTRDQRLSDGKALLWQCLSRRVFEALESRKGGFREKCRSSQSSRYGL